MLSSGALRVSSSVSESASTYGFGNHQTHIIEILPAQIAGRGSAHRHDGTVKVRRLNRLGTHEAWFLMAEFTRMTSPRRISG